MNLVAAFRVDRWPDRPRFVAAVIIAAAATTVVALLLLRQATTEGGQFGIDFADYYRAAERVRDGLSPYAPEMFEGPIDAQGTDRYRYPPPLAQALVPLTVLPFELAAWIWVAAQMLCLLLALVLVGIASQARSRREIGTTWRGALERVVWMVAASALFLPVFDSLWKGNVDLVLALLVAGAAWTGAAPRGALDSTAPSTRPGRWQGAVVAAAAIMKVSPATLFVPAASASLASRRQQPLVGALLAALGIVAISALFGPGGWADYLQVLPNLLAGDATYRTNLAPASLAETWFDLGDPAISILRIGTVVLGVALLGWSAVSARRPSGWPVAVAAATGASLLLPGAVWYHYLAVLVPLGALAWSSNRSSVRTAILGAGALVTIGIAALPLASLGGFILATAIIVGLDPRSVARSER